MVFVGPERSPFRVAWWPRRIPSAARRRHPNKGTLATALLGFWKAQYPFVAQYKSRQMPRLAEFHIFGIPNSTAPDAHTIRDQPDRRRCQASPTTLLGLQHARSQEAWGELCPQHMESCGVSSVSPLHETDTIAPLTGSHRELLLISKAEKDTRGRTTTGRR